MATSTVPNELRQRHGVVQKAAIELSDGFDRKALS